MAKRDFSSRAMSSKGHMTLFSPAVFKCIHICVNHVSIFVQAEVLLTRGDYPHRLLMDLKHYFLQWMYSFQSPAYKSASDKACLRQTSSSHLPKKPLLSGISDMSVCVNRCKL